MSTTTVNTEKRWWEVLAEANDRLRASPYINCYANLNECAPDELHNLADWFRSVAVLLDKGATLRENHADA